MAGIVKRTGSFLKSAVTELKRVRWPNRRELTSYTITVLAVVTFVAVFFALIDVAVTWVLEQIT